MEPQAYVEQLARAARAAAARLALSGGQIRNRALAAAAGSLRDQAPALRHANEQDLARRREFGLSDAMVDRLTLTDARIARHGVKQ